MQVFGNANMCFEQAVTALLGLCNLPLNDFLIVEIGRPIEEQEIQDALHTGTPVLFIGPTLGPPQEIMELMRTNTRLAYQFLFSTDPRGNIERWLSEMVATKAIKAILPVERGLEEAYWDLERRAQCWLWDFRTCCYNIVRRREPSPFYSRIWRW